jgi:hypothetical protein
MLVAAPPPAKTSAPATPSSHWFLWTVIIILVLAVLGGAFFFYAKYRKRQVHSHQPLSRSTSTTHRTPRRVSRSKNLASPIRSSCTSGSSMMTRRRALRTCVSRTSKVSQFEPLDYHGDYIELKYTQHNGTWNTVVATQSIQDKEHSYFEVEIDDNPKQCDVVVGYCLDKE